MRQFVTWGFWLSLLALAAMVVGVRALVSDDDPTGALPPQLTVAPPPPERSIDLIALVYVAQADAGFEIVDGRTSAAMQIRIDGFRSMTIPADTPGENRCAAIAEIAQCVVAADLLGEAVLWFSIVPVGPRFMVALPPIVELRDGQRVLLDNGWVVKRAETVERECEADTTSLTDFVRRFGPASTTEFSLDEQRVVRVTCADAATVTSTSESPTSTAATSTAAEPGSPTSVAPESVAPESVVVAPSAP